MSQLENKVPPPIVAAIVGALMWGVSRVTPILDVPSAARLAGVAVTAGFGVPFAAAAFAAFGRAGTTIDPVHPDRASSLVTRGVFNLSRNPMYVGLTLLLLGWASWLAAPWALLGPLAFVTYITRFQILPEERVMESKFGAEFVAYRERVRRWI
jgi:protein-S-isoprenylcysteine O-methyltransferase Ste14